MATAQVVPNTVAQQLSTLETSLAAKPGVTATTIVPDDAVRGSTLTPHVYVTGDSTDEISAAVDSNVRLVDHGGASGGTFDLTVDGQTASAIAYNAAASAVKSALEALSTVSTATVTGTGTVADPFVITLDDTGSTRTVTGDGASLTGGTGLTVSTPVSNCEIVGDTLTA